MTKFDKNPLESKYPQSPRHIQTLEYLSKFQAGERDSRVRPTDKEFPNVKMALDFTLIFVQNLCT